MTDDELKKLAKRVMANEVFLSWVVKDPIMLPMVFMPLALLTPEDAQKLKDEKAHTFWANMSDALPRSINGFPIFHKMGCLTQEEAQTLHGYLVKLEKAQEEALK